MLCIVRWLTIKVSEGSILSPISGLKSTLKHYVSTCQ